MSRSCEADIAVAPLPGSQLLDGSRIGIDDVEGVMSRDQL